MKIGIASDHGGFDLKQVICDYLVFLGYEVIDFGATELDPSDDYPDYVIPLGLAVASGRLHRGIAICGSGVGASIAANKIAGVRAALISEHFSAHQGVEDDNMNLACLGGRTIGFSTAKELVSTFLASKFSGEERHLRRLAKVIALEEKK